MRTELFETLRDYLAEERLVALATVIAGTHVGHQLLLTADGESHGSLGTAALDERVTARTREIFHSFASQRHVVELEGQSHDVFIEILPPRPRLMIVGAVHVAVPLVHFAKALGFQTIVIDPRTAFLTPERFAHADTLITEWPDKALAELKLNENSYVALLSHDLKLDLPALEIALRRPVRYVGALGSKKTHAKRVAAMREAGFSDDEMAQIYNPIGLPLGGRRAEEMAVSILAEIVAVRHDRRKALA